MSGYYTGKRYVFGGFTSVSNRVRSTGVMSQEGIAVYTFDDPNLLLKLKVSSASNHDLKRYV